MNREKFTIENMKRFRMDMGKYIAFPKIVKTKEEAINLTENDPTGIVWNIGDAYFEAWE